MKVSFVSGVVNICVLTLCLNTLLVAQMHESLQEKSILHSLRHPTLADQSESAKFSEFFPAHAFPALIKSFKSGLNYIKKNSSKALIIMSLTLIPHSEAFTVANLNRTAYCPQRSTANSLLPIIIENTSPLDWFSVKITSFGDDFGLHNLTSKGKSPISLNYYKVPPELRFLEEDKWNASGSAADLNELLSKLSLAGPSFSPISLIVNIENTLTKQRVQGDISFFPGSYLRSLTNLPQEKKYLRYGGPVLIDPITISVSGFEANVTIFLYTIKESGNFIFQNTNISIAKRDENFANYFSTIYAVGSIFLAQATSLLANLQFIPESEYPNDIVIGITIGHSFQSESTYGCIVLSTSTPLSTKPSTITNSLGTLTISQTSPRISSTTLSANTFSVLSSGTALSTKLSIIANSEGTLPTSQTAPRLTSSTAPSDILFSTITDQQAPVATTPSSLSNSVPLTDNSLTSQLMSTETETNSDLPTTSSEISLAMSEQKISNIIIATAAIGALLAVGYVVGCVIFLKSHLKKEQHLSTISTHELEKSSLQPSTELVPYNTQSLVPRLPYQEIPSAQDSEQNIVPRLPYQRIPSGQQNQQTIVPRLPYSGIPDALDTKQTIEPRLPYEAIPRSSYKTS